MNLRTCLAFLVTFSLCCKTAFALDPPITSIAFTPDNKSVCVCSQRGVMVHSWPNLKLKSTIECSATNLHQISFSSDGKRLAVAGGTPSESGTLQLLSWPDGESESVLQWHSDSVTDVVWLDQSTLATCGLDHDVAVWKLGNKSPVRTLRGHSRGVMSLCYLSGQNTLVSAGIDQSLRVWEPSEGQLIHSLSIHTLPVRALAFRPGQSGSLPMVASASEDRSVRIWQPTIGRMVRFARLTSRPLDITWTNAGEFVLASCENGSVYVIDPLTVEVVKEIPALKGWAYALAIHATDGSLVVGGSGGELKRIMLDP